MDEWIEFLKETLLRLAGVEVPTRMVLEVVSHVVPLSLDTTRANVLHLLRSSLCCKLVGPSVVAQVNRLILREVSQVLVKLFSDAQLSESIKNDLVSSLQGLYCPQKEEGSLIIERRIERKRTKNPETLR